MKGLIVTGLIGVVFFGGAYAYSTMQLMGKKDAAEEEAAANEQEKPEESSEFQTQQVVTPNSEMPVPFAPKTLSEEAILQLVESVRKKEAALKKRQEELNSREAKLRFILSDIQREKREYEAIIKEADAKVTEGQKILRMIETSQQKIDNDLNQIKTIQSKNASATDARKEAGDREIVKVLGSLQPEKLAQTLTLYANQGRLETVGEILSQLEKAKASKVIEAITDPALQVDVIEAARAAYSKQAGLLKGPTNRR